MKIRIILLLILITGSIILQAQDKLIATGEQIDKIFEGWTDESKPGIAVGILNNGKIEFNKHWGLANVEHKIPINEKTVFHFPGMVDQVIAFSILYLDEQGEIALDDKLSKYLENLPTSLQSKTIRSVLHHTSGLKPMGDAKVLAGSGRSESISKARFNELMSVELHTFMNQDEDQLFARAGIRILQSVIENSTGKTFADYAEQNIFKPLGMDHSQIMGNNTIIRNSADGYVKTEDGFRKAIDRQDYAIADQLYTTTNDICLWADNFWRAKIGSQRLWEKMDSYVLENGEPVAERNQSLFVGQQRYWNYMGLAKLYLIGQTEGFACKLIRYPAHDLAVVVLGNFGDYNGHLATMCSDPYLDEFYTSPDYSNKPDFKTINKNTLSKHTGQYWNYDEEIMAEVTLENDTLRYFEERFNWKTNLYPLADNKYYIDVRDGFIVEFKPTAEGQDLSLKVPGREEIVFSKFKTPSNWKKKTDSYTGLYTNEQLGVYYKLQADDQGLKLVHKANGNVILTPKSEDEFKSIDRQFTRIKFIKDSTGTIQGLKLSNANYKNIRFKKSATAKSVAQIN